MAKQGLGVAMPSDRAKDVWHIWKLLEANKDKEIAAFTSTLSIAECTHADNKMDQRTRDLFTRLLTSGQYVTLVQPTPVIAIDGRDLRWKHGILLKGADYIHVASGLSVKCLEMLTTDAKILAESKKIGTLGMSVIRAARTALLPEKYRQETFLDEKVTAIRPRAT